MLAAAVVAVVVLYLFTLLSFLLPRHSWETDGRVDILVTLDAAVELLDFSLPPLASASGGRVEFFQSSCLKFRITLLSFSTALTRISFND